MGTRITEHEDVAALFDSVTGFAFGPVFENGTDAEDFLSWLADGEKASRRFTVTNGGEELLFLADPRPYRDNELSALRSLWEEEQT